MNSYFLSLLKKDRKRKEEDWNTQVFWGHYTNYNGKHKKEKMRFNIYPFENLSRPCELLHLFENKYYCDCWIGCLGHGNYDYIDFNVKFESKINEVELTRTQDLIVGSDKPFTLYTFFHEKMEVAKYKSGLFFPIPTSCIVYSPLKATFKKRSITFRMRFIPTYEREKGEGFIFPGGQYQLYNGLIRSNPSSINEGYDDQILRGHYFYL
jgi:hypothetical protein